MIRAFGICGASTVCCPVQVSIGWLAMACGTGMVVLQIANDYVAYVRMGLSALNDYCCLLLYTYVLAAFGPRNPPCSSIAHYRWTFACIFCSTAPLTLADRSKGACSVLLLKGLGCAVVAHPATGNLPVWGLWRDCPQAGIVAQALWCCQNVLAAVMQSCIPHAVIAGNANTCC